MSHLHQRKQKDCLNCGTEVVGRYCHKCGQENIEPRESFWHLVTHYFQDITHFDGKFFSTLKWLIIRPGFLSSEYLQGKRQKYLHPIRMYVFTSAVFFVVFFSVASFKNDSTELVREVRDSVTLLHVKEYALAQAKNEKDSLQLMKQIEKIKSGHYFDSTSQNKQNIFFGQKQGFQSEAHYDSIQKALPPEKRDNWIKKYLSHKFIQLNEKYKKNPGAFWKESLNTFIHQFPKIFFISLPLFALILKLLYIRRKNIYYVDHSIYTIHLYIFSYIFFLVLFGVNALSDLAPSDAWNWLMFLLWLYWIYYTYKAMRRFYGQGNGKTFLKYLLLNIMALIAMIILFAIFFSYSIFQL